MPRLRAGIPGSAGLHRTGPRGAGRVAAALHLPLCASDDRDPEDQEDRPDLQSLEPTPNPAHLNRAARTRAERDLSHTVVYTRLQSGGMIALLRGTLLEKHPN